MFNNDVRRSKNKVGGFFREFIRNTHYKYKLAIIVPPGSTNPTNSATLISNLNPEEITDLLSNFEDCRKTLASTPHQ